MDPFYLIAMAIAIIVLILILTVIGVMLSYKNKMVFPPSKNMCPDYWTEVSDTSTGKMVCQIDDRNAGTFRSNLDSTPGYDSAKQTIDFKHPRWGNIGDSSALCAMKKWSNTNGILWDGVTNYNGCK